MMEMDQRVFLNNCFMQAFLPTRLRRLCLDSISFLYLRCTSFFFLLIERSFQSSKRKHHFLLLLYLLIDPVRCLFRFLACEYKISQVLISLLGIFSGNLSIEVSDDAKWNFTRSGFCGMRSKKVKFNF